MHFGSDALNNQTYSTLSCLTFLRVLNISTWSTWRILAVGNALLLERNEYQIMNLFANQNVL